MAQPWDATLARFTRATGIVVTFYSPALELVSGPHTPTPLTQQLAAAGGWDAADSPCRSIDLSAARQAQTGGEIVYCNGLEYLSLFALPVGAVSHAPEQRPGVLVGGWAFEFFPDSVVSHRLARRLGLPFTRLWTIVRQQPPLSRAKLSTYAELLQTLAEALQRQLDDGRALREAMDELERISSMKDMFLSTVSHELRTPLNAVLGWVQILRAGGMDDKERRQALEIVERNALAQAQLIDDLLDTTRIVNGTLQLNVRPVDLAQTLTTALETVRPAAQSKNIELRIEFTASVVPFDGDPQRLQQVFWNLLSNAVKFTPRGGRVMVRLWLTADDIRVAVTDTGPGIPADFLPQLFKPFTQVDNFSGRPRSGLGLGLAITRNLVELHGGTVSASSQGANQGATFCVALPLAKRLTGGGMVGGAPSSSIENTQQVKLPAALREATVLLIEDDDDTRAFVERALRSWGLTPVSAASASEARERFESTPLPAVIICDIGLPDDSGYTLIREFTRSAKARNQPMPPAIALTALVREADQRAAIQAGFQEHLGKPIHLETLFDLIVNLTEGSR